MRQRVLALFAMVCVGCAMGKAERRGERCRPGQACWPTAADWDELAASLTGKLVKPESRDAPFETLSVPRANGFLLEAEAFADLIQRRDRATLDAHRAASLDNLATLGALLQSARTLMPVDVPAAACK